MKLPKNYNYVEVYLTFRCNFNCSYCINKINDGITYDEELFGKEWVDKLNKIDFGDIPLTLGGGEPTLHPDFYYIINNLRDNINIDLLTNCNFNIDEFIENISPQRLQTNKNPAYKSIRVSYHPSQMNAEKLVEKVKKLQDAGFSVGIFGINHPKNTKPNMIMSELARKNNVYFFIKDFLGEYNGQIFGYYKYPEALNCEKREVLCKTSELLISPQGNIHRCHRDLYKNENPISNVKEIDFGIREEYLVCGEYGNCNPCDVKLKTNRFLNMGKCSVEIREIK